MPDTAQAVVPSLDSPNKVKEVEGVKGVEGVRRGVVPSLDSPSF